MAPEYSTTAPLTRLGSSGDAFRRICEGMNTYIVTLPGMWLRSVADAIVRSEAETSTMRTRIASLRNSVIRLENQ